MNPEIVVVGSLNNDVVLRVPNLPRAGETVTGATLYYAGGGKGANQALASARLGAAVAFVGCVGQDSAGEEQLASLEAAGVDCDRVMRCPEPTGLALILVDDKGENSIAIAPGANGRLTTEHVELALLNLVKASTIVVGSLEVPLPSIVHAALITAMRGATFVLNPSPGRHLPPDLVRQCAVVVPNEIELLQLGFDSPADLIADGAGAVVVTRGDRGASVRTSSASWEQPAFPVDAVDTTGAGDAFTAGLAVGLAGSLGLEGAVRLGAAAGALATTGVGARTSYPDRREADALMGGAGRP